MNTATESTRFTDTESEELINYRPVNRLAVLAAALGLLSATSLFHPVLLGIPFCGLMVALFAAGQLARGDAMQSGRAAMQWGLFLSLLFGTCAGSDLIYRNNRIDNAARRCAESWLELIRAGNVRVAHQLTLDDISRVAAGKSLDEHYSAAKSNPSSPDGQDHGHEHGPAHDPHNDEQRFEQIEAMNAMPGQQLAAFLALPAVKRISELGDRASYRFLRTTRRLQVSLTVTLIDQHFECQYQEGEQSQRFVLKLMLERTLLNRVATWKIVSVEEVKGV